MAETALITIPMPEPLTAGREKSIRHYVDNKQLLFAGKRILDLLISIFFIVLVLSWLLPLLAILIKLNSKGPVFFLQKRVGRGGKTFTCYKLRTIAANRVRHLQAVTRDDGGVTRLGQFLRQSNLDELPQFFNVLMGSMSVVGPRPHMHSDCHAFSELIPRYKFRNLVKPGITGLAQVKGFHGKVIDRNGIIKRYEWDVYYIKHAGFLLDMKIIFTTAVQRVRFFLQRK